MLNPPFLPKFSRASRSPEVSKGGTLYYPIWLAYATGVLEEAGHDVTLLDAPAEGFTAQDVASIVERVSPNLVVVETSTPSIYNDVFVADHIKESCPSCYVVLVGTHPSALPEETLRLSGHVDAVVRGEYDYTVRDLAEALEGEKNLGSVRSLSCRTNGAVCSNPEGQLVEDLDSLPFVSKVYKKHLDYTDYFYAANLHPVVTILSGRGCSFGCTFCLLPQTFTGRRYRMRSPENVVEELKYIKDEYPGVKEVMFEDDAITAIRPRIRRLCEFLIKEKVDLTWSANSRADVDSETLSLMKKAGCRLLVVGFESGSQEILDNIRKGIRVEQARDFAKNCCDAGIKVHGCFIFGLPGDDRETIRRTIDYAKSLRLDSAQFYPVMVYPRTELYDWAKAHNYLITEDFSRWLTGDGVHNCVVSYPELSSDELTKTCDRALREFYFRPRYIFYKMGTYLREPVEMGRSMKATKAYLKYILNRRKRL